MSLIELVRLVSHLPPLFKTVQAFKKLIKSTKMLGATYPLPYKK